MKSSFSYYMWDPYIGFVLPTYQKIKAITVSVSCMTVFLMGKVPQILRKRSCYLPEIIEEITGVQQQTNSVNCGLLAIAFATSLAFGEDPANVTYDSKKLRMHLIKYLDEKQMTCFPKSTEKRVLKCQSRLAAIELYCKCRMPYNESSTKYEDRMVECSQCLEWYHVSCQNIPAKLFDSKYKSEVWHCYKCVDMLL